MLVFFSSATKFQVVVFIHFLSVCILKVITGFSDVAFLMIIVL